jgi:hypothetical protein
MVNMFTGVPGVRHGFLVDLQERIEDVHVNAYAELGIYDLGYEWVIELSDDEGQDEGMYVGERQRHELPMELSDEEGQDEGMHEGERQRHELPIELSDEEGQDEGMHEGERQDEGMHEGERQDEGMHEGEEDGALPMPPLETDDEEELQIPMSPPLSPESQPGENEVGEEPSLRTIFPHTNLAIPRHDVVERVPPVVGPAADLEQFPHVNDPTCMDLDAACIMMLTLDLPDLFGTMARPANRRVKIRDEPEFADWLHVVSDPVVVRVFAGHSDEERDLFRANVVERLRTIFGLTLTCSTDSHTLSRNQVNISVTAMSHILYGLGARVCRVSFFGMKWRITEAEPILDRFIERYRVAMGSSVPLQKNVFDYGVRFETDDIVLYKFSDEQRRVKNFREGTVHLMCNDEEHGSLDFVPVVDGRIKRVKIYQELCHEILSVIQKQMLDHMPTSMRTMHTRLRQLQDLMTRWRNMTEEMRRSRFTGVRIELTVLTERVEDGRRICSEQDLFRIEGLERALGGAFETTHEEIGHFLELSEDFVRAFAACCYGRNERIPTVEIRSALTFARNAIGWSGKFMEDQLRKARDWAAAASAEEAQRLEDVAGLDYTYDGVQLDEADERPLIQDFLDHAQWSLPSKAKDRSVPGLMLKVTTTGRFLPMKGVYVDRVGAARYYIGLYGADWRTHVRSIG